MSHRATRMSRSSSALLSLFLTLLDLCGLPAESHHDGPSLVPLLRDVEGDWAHSSITHLADPGSYSLSSDDWRLIHYANGDEELYDIRNDPYEWTNLADEPSAADRLAQLKSSAPTSFARKRAPSIASLPTLEWHPVISQPIPASRPDGAEFDVYFINRTDHVVRLFWSDREGGRVHYTDINAGQQRRQKTRPGAVWMIADMDDKPLGYFIVGDRKARAVIEPSL